jgi:hypothetical protein
VCVCVCVCVCVLWVCGCVGVCGCLWCVWVFVAASRRARDASLFYSNTEVLSRTKHSVAGGDAALC